MQERRRRGQGVSVRVGFGVATGGGESAAALYALRESAMMVPEKAILKTWALCAVRPANPNAAFRSQHLRGSGERC